MTARPLGRVPRSRGGQLDRSTTLACSLMPMTLKNAEQNLRLAFVAQEPVLDPDTTVFIAASEGVARATVFVQRFGDAAEVQAVFLDAENAHAAHAVAACSLQITIHSLR